MRGKKFASGNPKTGLDGNGNTSTGLYKKTNIDKGYKPRGEGQGQRPTEKK